jgi:ATP-binding cassette subfamily B protein
VPIVLPTSGKGVLEFRNVSFGYHDSEEPVLDDISFTAKPGHITAIVGGTGSGKSTLISLIPRLYDVTGGEVLLDGVDIRQAAQSDIRRRIGYVSQKATLFSGTIASNISYGSEATEEEIEHAATVAQATEFIKKLDKKYDDLVAQNGTNLSGGQKQRISIARAIAKNPLVYVFDDSFSALDLKTDAALRKALAVETVDKTVVIVAQRISTVLQADQIVVLDEGKVAGLGTHAELMKSSKVYREIAESQLSVSELEGVA